MAKSAVLRAADTLLDELKAFEPGVFSADDCATLAERLASTAKACTAASVLAAVHAAECGAHRDRGFSDPASWMANHAGTTTREAKAGFETARGLKQVPDTKDALLAGEVSLSQAQLITEAEAEHPGGERELLDAARNGDLTKVRDAARERRQAVTPPAELHRRQQAARRLRHWLDGLGMVRVDGALPPETGIPLLRRLERLAHRLQRSQSAACADGERPERFEAHMADALVALCRPTTASSPGTAAPSAGPSPSAGRDEVDPDDGPADPGTRRSDRTELVIVCDLFAWRRGHAHQGEPCHIVGGGPIPVDLAKELSKDAFIKAVLHDGVAIHTVSHFGRHRPAHLQTALDLGPAPDFTGARCVDCGRRYGLQWDHLDPVANFGPTSYENLQARCYIDHHEKTERDRRAGLLGRRAAKDPPTDAPPEVTERTRGSPKRRE